MAVVRIVFLLTAFGACHPSSNAELRAARDEGVGHVDTERYSLRVDGGLAHARDSNEEAVTLRASCDDLTITLTRRSAALARLKLRLWNLPRGFALLMPDGTRDEGAPAPDLSLGREWEIVFSGRDTVTLRSAPPPVADFTFLAFGDIQLGIDRFDDVIRKVNAEAEADFILMLGDLTNDSTQAEFDAIDRAYAKIRFPIYATPGNHDSYFEDAYVSRFGRATYTCKHRGVRFTSIDSSAARLPASVWASLEEWLDVAKAEPHIVFSHIPATEPSGIRAGQWSSRREARYFVSRTSESAVDLLLFGHIHSYDPYVLGGIPTYISGGCGAIEERFDGIDRHYLRVKMRGGVPSVEVVLVDPITGEP